LLGASVKIYAASNPIFIVKTQLTERNGEQCGKKIEKEKN